MLRRLLGGALILLGLIFLIPEGLDFLNIALGGIFSEAFGITIFQGILLTYTLVPAVLIVAGAAITPGNTRSILLHTLNQVKALFARLIASPWGILVIILMFLLAYAVYQFVMVGYINDMIGGGM